MYKVQVDAARHRLLVSVHSFLTEAEQDGLTEELHAGAMAAKGSGTFFDILADFSQAEVLSQHSAKASEEWVAWCLSNGLRKAANIVAKALLGSQIKRVTPDPKFRNFDSRASAEAWLNE